jgi:hypothetical protein
MGFLAGIGSVLGLAGKAVGIGQQLFGSGGTRGGAQAPSFPTGGQDYSQFAQRAIGPNRQFGGGQPNFGGQQSFAAMYPGLLQQDPSQQLLMRQQQQQMYSPQFSQMPSIFNQNSV